MRWRRQSLPYILREHCRFPFHPEGQARKFRTKHPSTRRQQRGGCNSVYGGENAQPYPRQFCSTTTGSRSPHLQPQSLVSHLTNNIQMFKIRPSRNPSTSLQSAPSQPRLLSKPLTTPQTLTKTHQDSPPSAKRSPTTHHPSRFLFRHNSNP